MIEQLVQFALNNSLAALILASIVWSITRVWRNPYVSHVLWGLVFLKLICPTWVSLSLPVVSTQSNFSATTEPTSTENRFEQDIHDPNQENIVEEAYAANIQPAEIIPFTFDNEQNEIAFEEPSPPNPLTVQPKVAAPLTAVVTAASHKLTTPKRPTHLVAKSTVSKAVAVPFIPFSWPTILFSTSLFGTAVWLLIVARRITKFRQCVQLAEPVSLDVLDRAQTIASQLRLRHLPAIRWVDGSLPPMLWFSGRDLCIILPRKLWNSLTPEKQRLVLAHELIHIKRRDHIFRWIETAIFGLYWWNPVVWFARRHFHTAEDACCDQRTLALYPEHVADYGDLLVDSASFVSQSHLPLATFAGGIGHPHTLKTRVQTMLENTKRDPLSWPTRCLLAIGCCMFLAVSTQLYSADEPQPEAEETFAEAAEPETTSEEPTPFDPANTDSNTPSFDSGEASETTTDEESFGAEPADNNASVDFNYSEPMSDDFGAEPAKPTSSDNDPFEPKQPTKSNSNLSQSDTEIRSGASENIPATSARAKAQAALIAAIADPDPEVSEQAMLAVKRLGLISDDPNNKTLTPKLKHVMQQIAENPDANLSKRLEATIMLMPSKDHAELVLQALLDCHVRAKKPEEANKSLLYLYHFLERTPSEVIAKACQELTVSHNLKQLYKKIRTVSFIQPHRSDFEDDLVDNRQGSTHLQAELATLANSPVRQLALQLSVAAFMMGNSEIATKAFLEGYVEELEKSPTVVSHKDGDAEFYVAIQQPSAGRPSSLTTDEMSTILKLFRPETDAVLEFYISQMKSDNPKLRQLATAVLGNSLSGNSTQNASNNSRRSRGLSFGGGDDVDDRSKWERRDSDDTYANKVRTNDLMLGMGNDSTLDEETKKRIAIRYGQFAVIQKQIAEIYNRKQKQHAQTHSEFSTDDNLFDSRPRNRRKPKTKPQNNDVWKESNPKQKPKRSSNSNDPFDEPSDVEAPPFEPAVKKKTKSTTDTDDSEPAGRSGGGFF